jgi:hypothetical protein
VGKFLVGFAAGFMLACSFADMMLLDSAKTGHVLRPAGGPSVVCTEPR